MSTRLWNKKIPECDVNVNAKGLTLVGWHGDGDVVNTVGLAGSNRYSCSNKKWRVYIFSAAVV